MSQQETRLHLDILDEQRRTLWLRLKPLASRFYLTEGTALALQKGHRDSVDFDLSTSDEFDPLQLRRDMEPVFAGYTMTVTQAAPNTLSLLVGGTIRLSFFTYAYVLVQPLVQTSSVSLASIIDIGCMKLSAIVGRSTLRTMSICSSY